MFEFNAFDLPAWAHDELKAQCVERAIGVEELVKYLVCTHVKSLSPSAAAQFTVPREMESRFVGEGFMVIRRNTDWVVLTPCEPISFEDALVEFQANGCTKDDVIRTLAS